MMLPLGVLGGDHVYSSENGEEDEIRMPVTEFPGTVKEKLLQFTIFHSSLLSTQLSFQSVHL